MLDIFWSINDNSPGPVKVRMNFIKGLDRLGIPYNCNVRTGDEILCLQLNDIMKSSVIEKMVIGPNVCVLPSDNSIVMEQRYRVILVPSKWVYDKYCRWLKPEKVHIWAVGIDTDYWLPEGEKTIDCLIYFKRRSENELKKIKNILEKYKKSSILIKYGQYTEENFKSAINKSKFGIVLDGCESQGIAIMEMMSCNLPLAVWDYTKWNDKGGIECDATSIPYFDRSCGIKIDPDNLENSIKYFIDHYQDYDPRIYIYENFKLENKAKELLNVIKSLD